MAIKVPCPGCESTFFVKDALAGAQAKCPACGALAPVPEPQPEPAPVQALDQVEVEPVRQAPSPAAGASQWDTWYRPVKSAPVWPWIAATAVGVLLVVVLIVLLLAGGEGAPEGPRPPQREGPVAAEQGGRPTGVPHQRRPAVAGSRTAAGERAVRGGPAREVRPAPGQLGPEPARGSAERDEAAPASVAPARRPSPQDEVPTFPPGPLEGGTSEGFEDVLTACLAKAVDVTYQGVRSVPLGARLSAQLGGERYEGMAYGQFDVFVLSPGEPTVRELYLKITSPWRLADGTVLPPGTFVTLENGAYSVVDVAAMEARKRDIEETLAQVDRAAADRDWDTALEMLAQASERHPDSAALRMRAAEIRDLRDTVTITIINLAEPSLGFRISQAGRTVAAQRLRYKEMFTFQLKRGTCTAEWLGGNLPKKQETIQVAYTETWALRVVGAPIAPGGPIMERWVRRVQGRQRDEPASP